MPKPDPVDRGNTDPEPPVAPDETAKVYGDAFDEAVTMAGEAELSPAPPAEVPPGENPPPETPPPETPPAPPVETPPAAPPEPPPDTHQQPGETAEEYKQRWMTLQGIHRHDKEAWELEKQSLLAQIETSRKPPETPPGTPPPAAPPGTPSADDPLASLSPEERKALTDYEQDFDMVSKMEGIKREAELKRLRKEIDDKLSAIDARLKPVIQNAEERENEVHFSTIQYAHPDYEKFVSDGTLMAWIEKKPSYMQTAMKNVYENGTAEDAISLLDDFKRENNIQPVTPPALENVVNLNLRRAEKRKALAGVDTRRTAVSVQTPIKDDFDGAFDEAAGKQG